LVARPDGASGRLPLACPTRFLSNVQAIDFFERQGETAMQTEKKKGPPEVARLHYVRERIKELVAERQKLVEELKKLVAWKKARRKE
jgi:hypothetical protein